MKKIQASFVFVGIRNWGNGYPSQSPVLQDTFIHMAGISGIKDFTTGIKPIFEIIPTTTPPFDEKVDVYQTNIHDKLGHIFCGLSAFVFKN